MVKSKTKKHFPPEPFFGDKCPFCSNDTDLDYSPYDFQGWNVTQDVTCTKCGAGWTNHYDLHFVMADNFVDADGNVVG